MSNNIKNAEPLRDVQDDLQKLFRKAELRNSELLFHLDEIRFLKNLLDRYLLWLMEEEDINSLKTISGKLKDAESRCEKSIESNQSSLNRIGATIENAFTQDELKVRSDFRQQGEALDQFTLDMKSLKSEVFRLVEHSFKTEKARKLLTKAG